MPLDPGSHWLEAGITGLARQREWDAVATADAPGSPGDEVKFVALEDGRLLVEDGPADFDPALLAEALEGAIEAPYRAVAVRRSQQWAAGACTIDVVGLAPGPARRRARADVGRLLARARGRRRSGRFVERRCARAPRCKHARMARTPPTHNGS